MLEVARLKTFSQKLLLNCDGPSFTTMNGVWIRGIAWEDRQEGVGFPTVFRQSVKIWWKAGTLVKESLYDIDYPRRWRCRKVGWSHARAISSQIS